MGIPHSKSLKVLWMCVECSLMVILSKFFECSKVGFPHNNLFDCSPIIGSLILSSLIINSLIVSSLIVREPVKYYLLEKPSVKGGWYPRSPLQKNSAKTGIFGPKPQILTLFGPFCWYRRYSVKGGELPRFPHSKSLKVLWMFATFVTRWFVVDAGWRTPTQDSIHHVFCSANPF